MRERDLSRRLRAAALLAVLAGACGNPPGPAAEVSPSLPPLTTQPDPVMGLACNMDATPIDLRRASGRIQTTSPGRAGAVLGRFANATFRAWIDPRCPAGAQGEWTDDAGQWVVWVLVGTDGRGAPDMTFGTIVVEFYGEEPFLSTDASACPVTFTHFSIAGLAAHTTCGGLRWYNGYEAATEPESAEPVPGLPAFDLSLSFEGRP